MILGIAVIIFLVGCIVSSIDDASYSAQKREEELLRILSKHRDDEVPPAKQTKVTRRRIAQDKEGNVLAEEVTEETV